MEAACIAPLLLAVIKEVERWGTPLSTLVPGLADRSLRAEDPAADADPAFEGKLWVPADPNGYLIQQLARPSEGR